MPAKYRKLKPHQLLALSRAITAAARAIADMATQLRAEGCKSIATQAEAILEAHHYTHEARELNCAVRALVDLTNPVREELFLAAKEQKRTKRQTRKAAPRCGAWKATGGRCGTRLAPGEFRCPIHAADLRTRRLKRDGGKNIGRSTLRKAAANACGPEKTTTFLRDVSNETVAALGERSTGKAESGS
jgi:hypothetical protein